ncbi:MULTISPECIES: putative quinol monooxygenase [Falsihalocynthiibacter]|uniref:putative quinol monooxygenase n=1 Tax=Falsihalocynthiibacter TaxID=2854182 RepID=UPI00300146FA
MFAVTVSFTVADEFVNDFAALIEHNAAASVRDEVACQHFDVCTDPSNTSLFFLYEVYDDAAGFDVHLASAHFKAFSQASAHMVVAKNIATFQKVTAARA